MSERWEHSGKGNAKKRYDIIFQEYNYYFKNIVEVLFGLPDQHTMKWQISQKVLLNLYICPCNLGNICAGYLGLSNETPPHAYSRILGKCSQSSSYHYRECCQIQSPFRIFRWIAGLDCWDYLIAWQNFFIPALISESIIG